MTVECLLSGSVDAAGGGEDCAAGIGTRGTVVEAARVRKW